MASIDSAELVRSKRPGFGSLDSGMTNGPRAISTIITGMLIRNTDPHQ